MAVQHHTYRYLSEGEEYQISDPINNCGYVRRNLIDEFDYLTKPLKVYLRCAHLVRDGANRAVNNP